MTATVTVEEELHWLALRMVPGLGTRRIGLLLERLRTPQAIFRASASELEAAGLTGALAHSVASGCSFDDAASQQQKMKEAGAQLIALNDPRYPEALRKIFDPPPVLFARGRVELLSSISIGVVGTRHPTPYGVAAAERLSGDLARAGMTITSGMARGIDTAAHKAALAVAVSPSEARRLPSSAAAWISSILRKTVNSPPRSPPRGLIISEFPMGSTAFPQNFPIRNRIISGLSCGILVVEGAQYSGSSITARLAIDQGREVFAVPGNITSKMSWGPNLLIKQGAKLIQDWNDVVVDLPQAAQRRLIDEGRQRILNQGLGANPSGPDESSASPAASELTEPHQQVARRVLERLKPDQAIQLDQLVDTLEEASPSEIIAALFELEILGLVRQLPGRNFVKVW